MNKVYKEGYTQEKIDLFKMQLENAIGNKEMLDEVLSYANIDSLKAYLLSIGINPLFVEDAGIMEMIKKDLKENLSYKDAKCEFLEDGLIISGENRKEVEMYSNRNGRFYLNSSKYIDIPDKDGYIRIHESSLALYTTTIIGPYGEVAKIINHGGIGMGSEYSVATREENGNLPKISYSSTDGASYDDSSDRMDFGNPINLYDTEKTFKENYDLFTTVYPKLKRWYDTHFDREGKTIEEYSEYLAQQQEEKEISELENAVLRNAHHLKTITNTKNENYVDLQLMIEYIKGLKNKSFVGKIVAQKITNALKEVKKPQLIEIIEEPENEDDDSKKREILERKLQMLESKIKNVDSETSYIRTLINTLKIELGKIPVVGMKIKKDANKYSKENADIYMIDFNEDDERI